jgi:hypothetical protein
MTRPRPISAAEFDFFPADEIDAEIAEQSNMQIRTGGADLDLPISSSPPPPSPWRLRWHRMRPIAESIAVTLLHAAVVFIVTLVSLCLGGRSSAAALRSHLRLRPPRRHRPR